MGTLLGRIRYETTAMNRVAAHTQSLRSPTAHIVPWKFAHFVIKTARFNVMVDWYKAVLQAQVVQEGPNMCFLTYDTENHRLAIVHVPHLLDRPPDVCGVDHVSYTYRELGDLLSVYVRLKAVGIVPRWSVNHRVTTSFYYQDPDGNRVELQVENFPNEKEVNEFFASDDYARNTLGARFDPEEWISKYEAGASLAVLAHRSMPDFGPDTLALLDEMGLVKVNS
jgi:catechol 2,3-dioxygenase-like lactoylglutathione lyase family enzyme